MKSLLLELDVTEECPATVLKNHPNVTIIADEAACLLIDAQTKETFLTAVIR